jgi:hypothetical protein
LPPVAAPWVGSGLAPAILGTYLATLAMETLFVVRLIAPETDNSKLDSFPRGAVR